MSQSARILIFGAKTIRSLQTQRSIAGIKILCEVGRERDLTVAECLQATGLGESQLERGKTLVDTDQEFQVIRNLLNALGADGSWGFDAGMRYHPTTFAAWGFAVLSSLTARQAVEVGLRYLKLTGAFCQAHIEDIDDESHLVFDSSNFPADLQRFLVERELAAMLNLQRDVIAVDVPLERMEFQYQRPRDISTYKALFNTQFLFDRPMSRVVVKAELGNMPLPQGNRSALRYCEEQCQKLLDQTMAREGLSGRLREFLLKNTRSMPRMPDAARALNTSTRSLRRRLQDEGTDYESLVAEVRRSLAEELLRREVFNIEQIAERLGYAEVASFSRAFKRWTGKSPRQYRKV